jgi:hypothetical protein
MKVRVRSRLSVLKSVAHEHRSTAHMTIATMACLLARFPVSSSDLLQEPDPRMESKYVYPP